MNILLSTLRSIAYTILDPELALMMLILAIILYRENKKTTMMQKMIIGQSFNSAFELTISQIVIGIFAGAFGSIMLSFLGVAFAEDSAIFLVFLISIFLMFIKPKYICFAYSGAILGFISLFLEMISKYYAGVKLNLFGTVIDLAQVNIFKIDIVGLMTLVAVLHFVEGLLIIIDGKRGAIPVFSSRNDKIVGGFALKRNWVLPIALFLIVGNAGNVGITEKITTPGWWPLLKASPILSMAETSAVTLIAYYGVIGYSSVTFTKNKQEKAFNSGAWLIVYSALLLVAAQLANINYLYKLFVIIFAPAAHELIINLQKIQEIRKVPKYISTDEGIMVLEVAPASPAEEMGIKSGDLLLEVNSRKIEHEQDILTAGREGLNYVSFKLKRGLNNLLEVSYNKMSREKRLGIVFVPRNLPKDENVIKYDDEKFKDVLDKMKKKDDEE